MSSSLKGCLALACTSLFLTVACGGGEKAAPAAAPSSTAPAVTAPGGGAPLPVAEGDFGVSECDSYIKKYLACIDSKVPEATRAMFKQGLDQSKASWKQAVSTPEGRAGLAAACIQAEAATKQSTAAYGCQW